MEREITIKRDGLNLFGLFTEPDGKYDSLCIMLHGFGGAFEKGLAGMMDYLVDGIVNAGIAVLRFDFNGHGKSDGSFSDMNLLNEVCDSIAALKYARNMKGIKHIYFLGHSQGGVVAGLMAGYYHDVIEKLVLIAPAASLVEDARAGRCMSAEYDTEHIPEIVSVDGRPVGGSMFRTAKTIPIYETAALYNNKALIVYGKWDRVVTEEGVRKYTDAMPGARINIYERLDHGMNGHDCSQMIKDVVSFLGENL